MPPASPPPDVLPTWLLHTRGFQYGVILLILWPTLTGVLTTAWRLTPPDARRALERSPARAWLGRALRKSGLDLIPAVVAFLRALMAALGLQVPTVPGVAPQRAASAADEPAPLDSP